jgi:hypothetical protein
MDRLEHRPLEFVGVATPTMIYVGLANRDDFDRIAAPVHDSGENENGHVLTKTIGNYGTGIVIFQYWLKTRTFGALREDLERAGKAAT